MAARWRHKRELPLMRRKLKLKLTLFQKERSSSSKLTKWVSFWAKAQALVKLVSTLNSYFDSWSTSRVRYNRRDQTFGPHRNILWQFRILFFFYETIVANVSPFEVNTMFLQQVRLICLPLFWFCRFGLFLFDFIGICFSFFPNLSTWI